tara:strand:+ start:109 stop:585 length:477 start_codon:yes stop_codon:yes gene_type:complete
MTPREQIKAAGYRLKPLPRWWHRSTTCPLNRTIYHTPEPSRLLLLHEGQHAKDHKLLLTVYLQIALLLGVTALTAYSIVGAHWSAALFGATAWAPVKWLQEASLIQLEARGFAAGQNGHEALWSLTNRRPLRYGMLLHYKRPIKQYEKHLKHLADGGT